MLTMEQLKKATYHGFVDGWILPNGERLDAEKVYDVEDNKLLIYTMAIGFVITEKEDRNKVIITLHELANPEGYKKMKEQEERAEAWNKKRKTMSAKDFLIETGLYDRLRDFIFGKEEIENLAGTYYIDGFEAVRVKHNEIEIYAYDPEESGSYLLDIINYERLGLIFPNEVTQIPENRKRIR